MTLKSKNPGAGKGRGLTLPEGERELLVRVSFAQGSIFKVGSLLSPLPANVLLSLLSLLSQRFSPWVTRGGSADARPSLPLRLAGTRFERHRRCSPHLSGSSSDPSRAYQAVSVRAHAYLQSYLESVQ